MSHLSTERLAALVDEQTTADEQSHLTHCAVCARELEAHRSLFAMAGTERDAMQLPLTRWESLSRELRKEGLMAGSGKRERESESWLRFMRFPHSASGFPLRAAAALLLVAGGVLLGRGLAGFIADDVRVDRRCQPLEERVRGRLSADGDISRGQRFRGQAR